MAVESEMSEINTTEEMSTAPAGEPISDLLVRRVTWEADGIVSLDLVHPEGRELHPWEPGAHIDVILPSGLVRQYSLCGDTGEPRSYRIGVLLEKESRGGSREIHETALVGKLLKIRGPRNHFALVDAERYLFLAGGIGVTPMIPMLQEVERRAAPWSLVYGGRSRETMAFLDEILARKGGSCDIVPEIERGFPDLAGAISQASPGTAIYCCGPPGMISAVEQLCAGSTDPSALHIERFTAPAGGEAVDEGDNETFEVELARSGKVLTVPADRSLLRVVLDEVPSVLYSCEEGYCGTCETKVLSGEPDHRDTVLTDSEKQAGDTMMICVGRSKSRRLVLDL